MFLRQTLRSAVMFCGVVVLVAAMGREFFRPALNRLFVKAKMPAMVVAGEPEPAPYFPGSQDDQLFAPSEKCKNLGPQPETPLAVIYGYAIKRPKMGCDWA
jgi:hypothetical protein